MPTCGGCATVAAALELDADAVRLARHLVWPHGLRQVVRVGAYNVVVRHQRALLKLEREMPQLVPLFAAVADRSDFTHGREPAQAVRQFLLERGFGPRVWRLICRSGRRLFMPVRHFYKGATGDAMLDYLRVIDVLGLESDPMPG